MERQKRPLLWGGCFLLLALLAWLWAGGFFQSSPVGVKVLQAVGISQPESPRVLWEYLGGEGDTVLLLWDGTGFSPGEWREAAGKVTALEPGGEELWQRELPGEVLLQARGRNWAAADLTAGEVILYREDGRLAWRQHWTWPLQDIILSPRGEMAVLLGPLQEEGYNLLEKLVFVNEGGQAAWEYPLRNGTILGCSFDRGGDRLALTQLLFHREGTQNKAVLLDRQGKTRGAFFPDGEDLLVDTAVAPGMESWFVAGIRTLYCLDDAGGERWHYSFTAPLQRVLPPLVRGGVVVITLGEGGSGGGSILTYLDREGALLWKHRFSSPAAQLQVTATTGGILVGDGEGIYGLGYDGEINWYHPFPLLSQMAASPGGTGLLVYGGGLLTLLEMP